MRLVFLSVLLFASPAYAQSSQPTVWFAQQPTDVGGALANECANQSASVVEQDAYHVLCSKRVSGFKGALAQALIGNSYSTTPEMKVRFALIKDGALVRVQADQWLETQMAFGQVRREPLMNGKQKASLQQFMMRAGGTADRPVPPSAPSPQEPPPPPAAP